MAALLETLTPDQRAVITLRIVGDLTLDETAKVLGKRLGAVTQLQRRALASLRRALEQRGVTR
jgi:RNA polymerase sigma-70 factor (ECF subfamily)